MSSSLSSLGFRKQIYRDVRAVKDNLFGYRQTTKDKLQFPDISDDALASQHFEVKVVVQRQTHGVQPAAVL